MAALRFRFAPPAVNHGIRGKYALTINVDHSVGAGQSNRLRAIMEEEGEIYHVAKQILLASLRGYPQPLVIEAARTAINHHNQPSFAAVFDGLRAK